MNLVKSIFRGGFGLRADVGEVPGAFDDFWYNPVGSASSSGFRVTPESSKRLATVIACVSARAKALATLPCKMYTDLSGGGNKVVPNHPLYNVLYRRPNPVQTAFEFKMMLNAHVDLRGNGYALKVPGLQGPSTELWPLHPDRVSVEVIKATGKLKYIYDDPLTNKREVYLQDQIFHLRDWSDSMYVGQSRISMGMDMLGLAMARQDFMARWLKNDARGGLVMTGLNFNTKEDEKAYVKSVQEGRTGKNSGRTMMLPPGADIKDLGVKPIDAQLIEGHKASQVEICTLFGILPHLVGVDAGKSATYASVEQFNIMHAQQCVHPMVVMWEQTIQRDLVVSDRYYAKFSMASLLRGDNATRFAGYAVAIQNSWMCPDDVRALEDLNPIPDGAGKVFWRSANLLPLKQLTNPSQTPSSGGSTSEDQDDDDAAEDGAGGDAGAQAAALADPAMQGRLKLMAMGSADRCVRKEVAGVRRLIARKAGVYEVTEFYAEQARFIADVFHMEAAASLTVKIACDARSQHLAMLLGDDDDEFGAAAQVWIEGVASTEPAKLVALVVEGVR